MRLPAVNPFISFTKRAEIALDFLDKPERGTLLFFPGLLAHRTGNADFGQQAVTFRNLAFCRFFSHFVLCHCCLSRIILFVISSRV